MVDFPQRHHRVGLTLWRVGLTLWPLLWLSPSASQGTESTHGRPTGRGFRMGDGRRFGRRRRRSSSCVTSRVCSLRLSLHAHELIVREPRDPCAEQREADAGRDAGSADRRVAATWSDRRRFSRHTVDEPNQYQKAVQPTSSIDLGWEAIQSAQAAIRKCLDYPKPIAG
jgi:hypothetical protein